MADKNFKVKKNIQVTDLAVAGPVTVDSSGILASSSALPVNLGGTGQTSASAAFDALVPSQTNNANKLLGTDGTSVSWVSPGIAYQTSAPDNPVTGQLWVDSDETGDSLDPYIIRRKTITATAGQTVFTTDVVFTDGYEQIYYNGVLLVRTTDYTTNGGTNTVTLLQGASAGDTVEIISSTPINLVNTATISGGNTFTGFQTIQNSSNVSTNTNLRIINDGSAELLELYRNEATGLLVRRYNGTYSSQTGVLSGQRSAFMIGSTFDGTTYSNNSAINMFASENQTSTSRGSFINFETTLSGTVGRAERMRIDSSGNVGIGAVAPTNTRLYVYNSDVSNPVQSVLHNANAGGSRYHIYTSGGADAMSMQWDNNNATAIVQSYSTYPLAFRTNSNEKMRLGTGNDHVNMGFMRTWNIGQPTNMIVSGGTNCIRILINRALSQNYYRGFTFDVHGGGGYDWPGNGFATYFGKFMITFTGTDTGRIHLIQEYSRSYLNNTGTEITYNTFSATSDSNYYYLTINFKGINASQGYRPLFSVITYDAGNGGSTSSTGSNNQVFNVLAI
jgi:hypothetical protein